MLESIDDYKVECRSFYNSAGEEDIEKKMAVCLDTECWLLHVTPRALIGLSRRKAFPLASQPRDRLSRNRRGRWRVSQQGRTFIGSPTLLERPAALFIVGFLPSSVLLSTTQASQIRSLRPASPSSTRSMSSKVPLVSDSIKDVIAAVNLDHLQRLLGSQSSFTPTVIVS